MTLTAASPATAFGQDMDNAQTSLVGQGGFNLETAAGSPKFPQALGAPRKTEKGLITTRVTTTFSLSRGTPIFYRFFWRPTAVSRFKKAFHEQRRKDPGGTQVRNSSMYLINRDMAADEGPQNQSVIRDEAIQTASIQRFVVGGGNPEMGLESFDPDWAKAPPFEIPKSPAERELDGSVDSIEGGPATIERDGTDLDSMPHDIPTALVDHLKLYLANYFKPSSNQQTRRTRWGQQLFKIIKCNGCHTPDLVIERDHRVAELEMRYIRWGSVASGLVLNAMTKVDQEFQPVAPSNSRAYQLENGRHLTGEKNRQHPHQMQSQVQNQSARATLLTQDGQKGSNPEVKTVLNDSFKVKRIFANFKRHDLGPNFLNRHVDEILTKEVRSESLLSVRSAVSKGQDGWSANLRKVILGHDGKARPSRDAFARLPHREQALIIEYLQTLVLFGPPDMPSNLNPGDPGTPNFSKEGHGRIDLSRLRHDQIGL